MALSNYTELQASIGNWLEDSTLTAVIPDFVVLAEARFNRELRVPEMETVTTSTVSTETFAAPTGYLGIRGVWINESPDVPLDYFAPEHFKTIVAEGVSGKPRAYTLIGETIHLAPIPAAGYSISVAHYGKVPALASNSTNWLLTSHPDLYLAASLAAGEAFGWNDERIGLWDSTATRIIEELNNQGLKKRMGSAPLVARGLRTFS